MIPAAKPNESLVHNEEGLFLNKKTKAAPSAVMAKVNDVPRRALKYGSGIMFYSLLQFSFY